MLRSADGETALKSKEEMSKTSALGATFGALTEKEKKELNITSGVKVKAIEPGKLKSPLSGVLFNERMTWKIGLWLMLRAGLTASTTCSNGRS